MCIVYGIYFSQSLGIRRQCFKKEKDVYVSMKMRTVLCRSDLTGTRGIVRRAGVVCGVNTDKTTGALLLPWRGAAIQNMPPRRQATPPPVALRFTATHCRHSQRSAVRARLVGGKGSRLLAGARVVGEEGLGVGGGELRGSEGLDEVPLLGAGGAEELANVAGGAAAGAGEIAGEGAADVEALADVVASHGHHAGHAEGTDEAVGNDVARVTGGVGEELAGAAVAAEAPREAAEDGSVGVRGAAAGGNLPALVEGTRLTSPVHLVKAKDTVDSSSLNLGNSNVEGHV